MGSRIALLKDGVVQQIGNPQEVYDNPSNIFVAGFLGSPSMNFLDGELSRNEKNWTFFSPSMTLELPTSVGQKLNVSASKGDLEDSNRVTIGIRPESVEVVAEDKGEIRGEVDLIQSIGSDKYLTVIIGETRCTVRTDPRFRISQGDPVSFDPDWEFLHIFDNKGKSLFWDNIL